MSNRPRRIASAEIDLRLRLNAHCRRLSLVHLFASLFLCAMPMSATQAQLPVPAVSIGFGMDTTIADVGAIVRLTRAYLARPDSSARSRGLWSAASEFDHRVGDLTAGEAYQGFPATIIGVTPAPDARDDSVYVVKLLYARADTARHAVVPLALQRLYAVRESGGPFPFRLSGALPRLTQRWERRTSGPMTFWYAPGQRSLAQMRGNAGASFAALPAQLGLDGSDPNALDRWWRSEPERGDAAPRALAART